MNDGPRKYGYDQKTCHEACQGYQYFALQNGGWCVCGDAYSTQSQYEKKPDSECGGIRGLGGQYRNSIYKSCTIIGKDRL